MSEATIWILFICHFHHFFYTEGFSEWILEGEKKHFQSKDLHQII